jgi:hypothetical protein
MEIAREALVIPRFVRVLDRARSAVHNAFRRIVRSYMDALIY